MTQYLLSLDAGTGSARALLVDIETGQATVAARPWSHPLAPQAGDWAYDFDVDRAWALLVEAAREVQQKAAIAPAEVVGIAATSMRHSLVLVRDGRVLLAVPNKDARAAAESMELAAGRGAALAQCTGRWPAPVFMAPRLQWLARHHPAWLDGAIALAISDWIALRLCGAAATDLSQAGETMLFDIHRQEWRGDWLDEWGLPRGLCPPVRAAGTLLGALSAAAAADLGLTPGIPVAVGGADTQCALLGVGALGVGDVVIVAGTTTPVQAVLEQPLLDSGHHLWTGLHACPGRWVLESNAGAMGEPLEWFAGLLYPDSPRPVARLMAEARLAPPGAAGIFSTFGAQVFDARNMVLPVGSLTLSHFLGAAGPTPHGRRHNLARAILEGLAYAVRANIEQIEAVAGRATSVFLTGGLTRSSFWAQLVADVLGRPVRVAERPESTALGAAICAGVGAGVFADLAEGAARLARTHTIAPDAAASHVYPAAYADWQRLRVAQAPAHDRAADLIVQTLAEQPPPTTARPPLFRPRFLVTAQLDDASLAELRTLGEVEYANYRETLRVLVGDDLVDALQSVHVLITEVDVVDLDALQRLPDLRVVVSCRGRAVNVDLAACTALGIPVLNAPGRNADAVADLTVAFMLALARKLIPADRFLRQPGGEAGDMGRMGQAHEQFLGRELWGQTVGLVGLGAVGRQVARRLTAFGARLLVYDPYLGPEDATLHDAELVSLEELLAGSDIVSLHAPVTAETRGLIGPAALARMKPGALLVNTARAALVDEAALLAALQSGHLAGAALDVFAEEPPAADHPLLALPNVIATPHMGGNTVEVAAHQGRMIVADIRRMLVGERPQYVLNPEALDGFSWTERRRPADLAALADRADQPGPAVSDLQQAPAAPISPPKESPPAAPVVSPSQEARQQMERLLRRFCEQARADPALNAFAAKRRVISHYTLTDLGLEFYVGFWDGAVVADVGAPPAPAEVRMKASAETLDGILTGQVSGNKAAMSGKLTFSGSVRLAMGLQRIQNDLVRLYTAARAEAGGMDLALLAPKPACGAPAGPLALDIPADPREQLVQVVTELFQLQLITATGGNASIRVEGQQECWITPSQLFKGNLRPEAMVRIDFEDNVLDAGGLAPSSERALHLEIYKARPDVQAIIHAHAPYATILGMSGLPFLPVTTDAAFLKEVPVVPFIMPGTKELALATAKALGQNPACILRNHGIVAAASSLRRAANLVEAVERTAQLILGCHAVGKKPPVLPKDVVKMLQEVGEMLA